MSRLLCLLRAVLLGAGLTLGAALAAGCKQSGMSLELIDAAPATTTSSTSDPDDLGIEQSCCVKGAHGPFEGPDLFFLSTPGEPNDRTCEDVGLSTAFTAYADPSAPPAVCPACECSPASCKLPEEMHASGAKCADADGAPALSFSADPGWEGTCTDASAIPADLQCGGVACVQSVTVSPAGVEPCKPISSGEPSIPGIVWGTEARRCSGKSFAQDGCGADEVCVPSVPEGAAVCLWAHGLHECEGEEYPHRVVVYETFEDERTCSPCTCGEPQGGECIALISLYSGAGCVSLAGAVNVDPSQPACVDVLSGTALASKGAFFKSDKPGSCTESGGEAVGDVQLGDPLTLCCPLEPPPLE